MTITEFVEANRAEYDHRLEVDGEVFVVYDGVTAEPRFAEPWEFNDDRRRTS